MDLATGAMGSLLPKLLELLKEEYKLKKNVKDGVRSLEKEMKSMHAALRKVAEVPREQLDDQVKLWAGEVRELSFDMEDVADKFLVRVDDDPELATKSNKLKRFTEKMAGLFTKGKAHHQIADEVRELSFDMEDVVDKFLVHVDDDSEPATNSNKLKRLTEKMTGLFTKGKARHQIADAIKDINKQVEEVANRRGRYTVDSIVTMPAAVPSIDPRLKAMYKEVTELVGIAGKRDEELMKLLSEGDNEAKKKLRIVSVVGFGGLGKTTLVKMVYDKIKGDFDCRAFVPVGRNASAKKILLDILLDLGMYQSHFTVLDERQLIDKLRESLENKRYLVVVDDIWDEELWTIINLAFSGSNNFGSKLITTTRIVSVSKLCCSSTNDYVYQMTPLSDDDSKRLFYKRIFSQEIGCPCEFEEVSIDILKKCGGVPLAIITIASLLAGDRHVKHVDEWYALLKSIGRGLTEDHSVGEMLRILSFSYYDLPSHLKTCLLYLSMFPEDYEIKKDRLIWMWIAESFVQCEKAETSLFEIEEMYFNELVNRNMIQAMYNNNGNIEACRVHDMVLDLISSLSGEENFAVILNGTSDSTSSQSNVRRLSLQSARNGEDKIGAIKPVSMLQVRFVVLFQPAISLMPSFSSFVVLRVLDLCECDLRDHNHLILRELGSLLHLRYLGLARTRISEIPEEFGKLQFLQVLDLSRNDDMKLPSAIINLRRLMCLLIGRDHKKLPVGLANLTSMEVLSKIRGDSLSIMNELGSMVRLRKLGIRFQNMSLELEEAFVVSLGKLSNIQSVEICRYGEDVYLMDLLGERWVPPRSLREFLTYREIKFSTLPAWIRRDPSRLSQLSVLRFSVKEVRQEDLGFLGSLPALRILVLYGKLRQSGLLLVGTDGFRCLTSFEVISFSPGGIMFQPGAMPKAEKVELAISVRVTKEEATGNSGDCFDLGMENLSSLRKAEVTLNRKGVSVGEARQAKFALENALRAHPNRPTFEIDFHPVISDGFNEGFHI